MSAPEPPRIQVQPPTLTLPVVSTTGESRLVPLAELPVRGRVLAQGYVYEVTSPAAGGHPIFVARVAASQPEPDDNTIECHVHLRWLGQRSVPGITPGTNLLFEGMISLHQGVPTILNPRYEILP